MLVRIGLHIKALGNADLNLFDKFQIKKKVRILVSSGLISEKIKITKQQKCKNIIYVCKKCLYMNENHVLKLIINCNFKIYFIIASDYD